jgi:glycerol uptake facilitator-like aquaporin
MIQRIQSIYLLLASICVFLCYYFSFAKIYTADTFYDFNIQGIFINDKNVVSVPYRIIIPALALFSFFAIFMFKNRKAQLIINRFNTLLHIALIVFIYFSAENTTKYFLQNQDVTISYGLGFFLPVVSLAFLLLANKAIKKDEKLIKAIDRLRG